MSNWFDVDRKGLAKLLADRSPAFVLFELVSNAWDTRAKVVEVTLEPAEERGWALLVVGDDDPDGFSDLSRSWTLFAESERKARADKRGRFCLGEKLVLAQCLSAEIVTTKGGVLFDADGRRSTRSRTATGSVFRAVLKMNRAQLDAALADFRRVIPPTCVVPSSSPSSRRRCRPSSPTRGATCVAASGGVSCDSFVRVPASGRRSTSWASPSSSWTAARTSTSMSPRSAR